MNHHRILLAALLCLLAGCAKASREQRCCPCSSGKQLDRQLMMVLASARAHHHQADIHLRQGQTEQAMAAVQKILELNLDARWPEAEEVRLDATARLAKLLLARKQSTRAASLVDGAIAGARRESFYLSNLHGVRGEILEHQARAQDQAGDKDGARKLSREAIAAYEKSITINKRLQQQLLRKEKR